MAGDDGAVGFGSSRGCIAFGTDWTTGGSGEDPRGARSKLGRSVAPGAGRSGGRAAVAGADRSVGGAARGTTIRAGGASWTAAGAGALSDTCRIWLTESGLPPLLLMASCRRSKLGGARGGWVRATTVLACTAAGGRNPVSRPEPTTACRVGTAAGANVPTDAPLTVRSSTRTTFLPTGCAELNACDVVATTAPATDPFT